MRSLLWFVGGAVVTILLILWSQPEPGIKSPDPQPAGSRAVSSLAELIFGPSAEVAALREIGATSRLEIQTATEVELQQIQERKEQSEQQFFLLVLLVIVGGGVATVYFWRKQPAAPISKPLYLLVQKSPDGSLVALDPVTGNRTPLLAAPPRAEIAVRKSWIP